LRQPGEIADRIRQLLGRLSSDARHFDDPATVSAAKQAEWAGIAGGIFALTWVVSADPEFRLAKTAACVRPKEAKADDMEMTLNLGQGQAWKFGDDTALDAMRRLLPATRPEISNAMLLTGGLGDVFTVESFMSPEERAGIQTIYYACPWPRQMQELFAAIPTFPNLKTSHEFKTSKTYHNRMEAEAVHGKIPARDYSIFVVFHQARTYTGSSWLMHRLCEPPKLDCGPYAAIVPYTSWGRREGREFSAADWETCLRYLEAKDLRGVLLYSGPDVMPEHPRLVNMANKTNIVEAVEILKGAVAYLGIDSALSVLAAKLFPRIAVKTISAHTEKWKRLYFSPRTDFSFLQPVLTEPTG
jgi:hypothetical protein